MGKRIYTLVDKKKRKPLPAQGNREQKHDEPFSTVTYLHGSLGNQQIQQLYQEGRLQALLKENQPSHSYEEEANRIAKLIVSQPAAQVKVTGRTGKKNLLAKLLSLPGKKKKQKADLAAVEEKIKGLPGQQGLDEEDKEFFGSRFNRNLDNVKIHANGQAAGMAEAIGARAFALDNHLVFNKDQYAPETAEGKELLAHELTHVVQQQETETEQAQDETKEPLTETVDQQAAGEAREEESAEQLPGEEIREAKTTEQQPEEKAPEEKTPEEKAPEEKTPEEKAPEEKAPEEKTAEQLPVEEAPAESLAASEAEADTDKQGATDAESQASATGTSSSQAGGFGGGGAAAAAETGAQILTEAEDPAAVLTQLQNVPPTQAVTAYSLAQPLAAHALTKVNDNLQEKVPEITAPTGMPTTAETVSQAKDVPITTPEPLNTLQAGNNTDAGQPQDVSVAVSGEGGDVSTSLGPAPALDMSGAADPAQLGEMSSEASGHMQNAKLRSQSDIAQDFGDGKIAPTVEETNIEIEKSKALASVEAQKIQQPPPLPPDAAGQLNSTLAPVFKDKISQENKSFQEQKAEYDLQAEAARAEADQKITNLNTEAAQKQSDAKAQAQAEVAGYKDAWQKESEQVDADYQNKSDKATKDEQAKIDAEQQKGEAKAEEHFRDAEQKAQAEKAKANQKAKDEENKAKEKPGGILGFLQDVGSAIVSGLKKLVDGIFTALRAFVKFVFETAKKLALAALELARKAIVAYIKGLGMLLKGLISIALAAFPKLAEKFIDFIDKAINAAVNLVNTIAEGLKKAVTAVLDFLANTLDQIYSLVQSLFNGIFTVIGMIISGEFAELIAKIGCLIAAAKAMPAHFEGAAWEELLGVDISKPMPGEEGALESGAAEASQAAIQDGGLDEQTLALLKKSKYTAADIAVEPIATLEAEPELSEELLQIKDGGEQDLGEDSDPSRSMDSIKEEMLGGKLDSKEGAAVEEAALQPMPTMGRAERAKLIWEQMKKFLADWFAKNWVIVLAGFIAGITGFIALNIVTGGAITAALPVLMNVLSAIFIGLAVVKIAGHVKDYVSQGWNGETAGAAKSLAKALAAGAIELIMALGFKAIGAAAKAGAKAATAGIRAVKAGARATANLAKGAMKLVKSGAGWMAKGMRMLIKGGKFVFQGAKRGFLKAVRSIKGWLGKLFNRFRFKGFKIKRRGWFFELWGKVNPWVLVMTVKADSKLKRGSVVKVEEPSLVGTKGPFRIKGSDEVFEGITIGSTAKNIDRLGSRFVKKIRNNPQLRESVLELLENAPRIDNDILIKGLSNCSGRELNRIVNAVKRLRDVDGIEKVIGDLAAGGNKKLGAEWVLKYVGQSDEIAKSIKGFEVTDISGNGLRRYDFKGINGRFYELKNWSDFANNQRTFLEQMAKDLTRTDPVVWIFAKKIGNKNSLIKQIETLLADIQKMEQWGFNPVDFPIDEIKTMIQVR